MSTVTSTAAALSARARADRASNSATPVIGGTDAPSTRQVALASMVGTTIEYYDYAIFGTAAALVFGHVFYPQLGGATGALAALASLAVAFVFRPVGSVLFGHFGDRLGRKSTLIITLLLMGISTVGVGLLPSAATIGVAAPILLVLLRALQGMAVGGEWAGAALFAAESAPSHRRGRFASFPQLGPTLAFVLSCLTFLIIYSVAGKSSGAFLDWGWRVPFLLSGVLIAVGLWIRLRITETPVFAATARAQRRAVSPFAEVWRRQPRTMVLTIGLMTGMFACGSIGTVYLTSYGTSQLRLNETTVLLIDILAAVAAMLTTILGACWSDRIGRRRIILGASLGLLAWSLVMFPLMGTGSTFTFGLGLVVFLALLGLAYGPIGAYLPETFATMHRYTGAGLAYNLGGVVGGGVALIIAPILAGSATGPPAIGIYLAVMTLASAACMLALPETKNASLTHTRPPAAPGSAVQPLSMARPAAGQGLLGRDVRPDLPAATATSSTGACGVSLVPLICSSCLGRAAVVRLLRRQRLRADHH
jgi:MFS family permease